MPLTFEILPKGVFWSGCPVGWCSLKKSNGTLLEVEFAGKLSILDPSLTPINMVKVDTLDASTIAVDPKPTFYHESVDSPRTRESGTSNNSSANSSQLSTNPIIFDSQVCLQQAQRQANVQRLPLQSLAPDKEYSGRDHSDMATNRRPEPTPTPNTPTPITLTPIPTNSSARIPQPRLRASKQVAAPPETTSAVSAGGRWGILGWLGLASSPVGAAAALAGGGALPQNGRRSRDSSPTQQAVTQILSPRLRAISTDAGLLPARANQAGGGGGGGRGVGGAPNDAGATSLQKRRHAMQTQNGRGSRESHELHAMQTQNGPRDARLQALLSEVLSLYSRSLLPLQ
jgi:hypothetical protein